MQWPDVRSHHSPIIRLLARPIKRTVALEAAGVAYNAEVYEGAVHGYTMADTPAYDEAAAERHFEELFALLGRTVAA